MDPAVEVGLALGGVFRAWVAWEGLRGRAPVPHLGAAIAVDDPAFGGMPLMVSDRWRLRGRPDELRRLPDGAIIPVEIKSCRSPRSGVPYPSHRVQLLAYCALVEETCRRAPLYGILSYGDGNEVAVPWDARARAELRDAVIR